MNERIKQLKEQAMEWVPNQVDPDTKIRLLNAEKFAELIVKECVAQIQPMWDQVQEIGPPGGYDYDTFDLAYNDCMNAIKEHFGVEE
jgi:hypothetical protein